KRRSRVQRQVRRDSSKVLRIERKHMLKSLDRVGRQHRDQAEEQHHYRILSPHHLARLINPRQPINEPLDRTKDTVSPCALSLKDRSHIHTERLGTHEDQCKKEKNL